MKISVLLISFAIFTFANAQSKSCVRQSDTYRCDCAADEDLELYYDSPSKEPGPTSLVISSCASVDIPVFIGLKIEHTLRTIIVENIRNTLKFDLLLPLQRNMSEFAFLKIGNIPEISRDPFSSIFGLDKFRMENTKVQLFADIFAQRKVKNFILRNVTIEKLLGLDLSHKGGILFEIINCRIKVTNATAVNIDNFQHIKIIDSTIEFSERGDISFSGNHVELLNNVFVNAIIAVSGDTISSMNTCADGRGSSMRLVSNQTITSRGNQLPTEIVYVPQKQHDTGNNTVCKAGNCNCPRNHGKTVHQGKYHSLLLCLVAMSSVIVVTVRF